MRATHYALPLICVVFLVLNSQPSVKAAEKKPAEVRVASIVIAGMQPEGPQSAGLFGEIQPNLSKTMDRLEKAAGDKTIRAVVLTLEPVKLGAGTVHELRSAVRQVRKSGKKVYARMDAATSSTYLIAAACDQIIMPPSGTVILPGIRAEVTLYKNMLDKLGIEADILHVGEAKGAGEPYTRTTLSPAVKKNLNRMVGDLYNQMVATIAKDRNLKPGKVRELIDHGLFSATDAKNTGLIDRVQYSDQTEKLLKKQLAADSLQVVKGYGKRKVDTDFSGPAGFFKLMKVLSGSSSSSRSSGKKKVAIVYAVGAITTGKSRQGMFGGSTLGSDTVVAALRKANANEDVVAIVLRVNSPGGSALASDLIWKEIQTIKKPVVASMGDVAGSGGYYISMGADKIVAEPGTVTGSIGVVGGKMSTRKLREKVGITADVLSRGKNSGVFSTTDRFTKSERLALQTLMQDVYRQFTMKAAKGRKMPLAKLENVAGGQVWTGATAKELGLVDQLGTLNDALAEAKKLAGLKKEEQVEILTLPESKTFFEQLFSGPDEEQELTLQIPIKQQVPELSKYFADLETFWYCFREPAVMMMPYRLDIE